MVLPDWLPVPLKVTPDDVIEDPLVGLESVGAGGGVVSRVKVTAGDGALVSESTGSNSVAESVYTPSSKLVSMDHVFVVVSVMVPMSVGPA